MCVFIAPLKRLQLAFSMRVYFLSKPAGRYDSPSPRRSPLLKAFSGAPGPLATSGRVRSLTLATSARDRRRCESGILSAPAPAFDLTSDGARPVRGPSIVCLVRSYEGHYQQFAPLCALRTPRTLHARRSRRAAHRPAAGSHLPLTGPAPAPRQPRTGRAGAQRGVCSIGRHRTP